MEKNNKEKREEAGERGGDISINRKQHEATGAAVREKKGGSVTDWIKLETVPLCRSGTFVTLSQDKQSTAISKCSTHFQWKCKNFDQL